MKSCDTFKEFKQNWLGYAQVVCGGSALEMKFATALDKNLNISFNSFGKENGS